MYIVAQSLSQGRRAGLASVAGVAAGNFGNALGTSLGLAAVFAWSSVAFLVVKYAGAAYLVWLGVKAIRGRRELSAEPVGGAVVRGDSPHLGRLFRDGFFVALLNPKTAVFFAAFLPQFMTAGGSHALQSVVLGGMFVLIAATTDTLYAAASGSLAPAIGRLRGAAAAGRYVSGGTFVGLGVWTALSGARTAK